jgi:uridine kinase
MTFGWEVDDIARIYHFTTLVNMQLSRLNQSLFACLQISVEHVRKLSEGQAIDRPVYDFARYERASETIRIASYPAIILEGILIFENKALRDLMDIKIFVDTDADLRFIRRLRRDIENIIIAGERGHALVERILAFSHSAPLWPTKG